MFLYENLIYVLENIVNPFVTFFNSVFSSLKEYLKSVERYINMLMETYIIPFISNLYENYLIPLMTFISHVYNTYLLPLLIFIQNTFNECCETVRQLSLYLYEIIIIPYIYVPLQYIINIFYIIFFNILDFAWSLIILFYDNVLYTVYELLCVFTNSVYESLCSVVYNVYEFLYKVSCNIFESLYTIMYNVLESSCTHIYRKMLDYGYLP
jgi:phage-related protein